MPDPDSTVNRDDALSLFVEATFADVPDRIPMLPTPGVYPHPSYGDVDLTVPVVDQIIANFEHQTYQKHIPIDAEHNLATSGAAAYITGLHKNSDGSVDASVEWTDLGRQLVASDRFRYISPAIKPEWVNPATRQTHKHILAGAGLTTRPFFKEQALRPLITASEPVEPGKGRTMSEHPTQESAAAEGAAIVDQKFGERLALAEQAAKDWELKFTESETARKADADRIAALEAREQDRQFSEALKGAPATQVPAMIAELKALPDDLRAGYIARVQADIQARRQFAERPEIGSDAHEADSAAGKLEAKAREIQMAEKVSYQVAYGKACEQNPALYKQFREEEG